jgi:hypothetical protein
LAVLSLKIVIEKILIGIEFGDLETINKKINVGGYEVSAKNSAYNWQLSEFLILE